MSVVSFSAGVRAGSKTHKNYFEHDLIHSFACRTVIVCKFVQIIQGFRRFTFTTNFCINYEVWFNLVCLSIEKCSKKIFVALFCFIYTAYHWWRQFPRKVFYTYFEKILNCMFFKMNIIKTTLKSVVFYETYQIQRPQPQRRARSKRSSLISRLNERSTSRLHSQQQSLSHSQRRRRLQPQNNPLNRQHIFLSSFFNIEVNTQQYNIWRIIHRVTMIIV